MRDTVRLSDTVRVYTEQGYVVAVEVWRDGRWDWESFETVPEEDAWPDDYLPDDYFDDPSNFVDFDARNDDERLGL